MMAIQKRTLVVALLWAGLQGQALAELQNKVPGEAPGVPVAEPVLSASAPAANPAAVKASPAQAVDSLLQVSGIRRSLEKMPAHFQAGFKSALSERAQNKKGALPAEVQQAIEAGVKESFTEQGFVGRVTGVLKKGYQEKNYRELINDLSTPVAKQAIELEAKDATEEQIWMFASNFKSDPKSAPRMELIHRMDVANRSSDLNASISLAIAKGIMHATTASAGCVNEQQMDRAESSLMESSGDATRDSARYMVEAVMAYTYRELSDADFGEYVAIYEKENTQRIHDVIFTAINDEIGQGSRQLRRSLLKFSRERQQAKGDHGCDAGPDAAEAPTVPKPASEKIVPAQPVAPVAAEKPAPALHSADTPEPKSGVPMEKRQGADARQCLDLPSPREIALCAEKYRKQ